MSLTKLTTAVNIIAGLSDTPNATEGLTATQLKAKFDEASGIIKDYINNTLTAEIDTSLAESTSYQVFTTRDISVTGDQTVTLLSGKTAKKITIYAHLSGSSSASWGIVASNSQTSMIQVETGAMTTASFAVYLRTSSGNFATGTVTIESGQIKITWAKTGSPTGTGNLTITADYHH